MDPAELVTVTVDVDVVDSGLELPPQPTTTVAITHSKTRLRYILRLRKYDPKQSRPPPSKARVIVPRVCTPGCDEVCCWAVLMDNVVCAAPPFGVTVVGLKLQVAPAGSPEQVKLTCWLKPPDGVMLMAVVTDWPAVVDPLVGERLRVKSTGGALITTVILGDVDDVKLLSPP